MAFDGAINFRSTSGYVSDPVGTTYSLGEAYPVTRGGLTFGWYSHDRTTSPVAASQVGADRTTSGDARLAGIVYTAGDQTKLFRLDGLTPGSVTIHLANGDSDVHGAQKIEILDSDTLSHANSDDAVVLASFTTGEIAADTYNDATGTPRTRAGWPGSETGTTVTITGTSVFLRLGIPTPLSDYMVIAHFRAVQSDGGGPTTATVSGPSGGAASTESTAFTVTLGSASVGTTTVNLASTDGDAFRATSGGSSVASIGIADGETVGTFYLFPDATVGARTITPTASGITFTPTTLTYTTTAPTLVAGVASFVSSGPGGIVLSATDASGGTAPYEDPQWQRNENGGDWSDLSDGGGVSGATTLELSDGSAEEGVLYRYRCVYTDADEATATSNAAPAAGVQVYPGGPLAGGTSGPSIGFCRFIRGIS